MFFKLTCAGEALVFAFCGLTPHLRETVPAPLQVIVKSREFALFVGELQSGEAEESSQLPVGGPSVIESISADDETYRASRLKLLNTILSEK